MNRLITYITLTHLGKRMVLASSEIIRVESAGAYTVFYIRSSSQQYVCSRNLGRVYKELNPEMFLRVHRSHIINLGEIKEFQLSRGGKVTMSDDTVVTIAQRRKTELLRSLCLLNKKARNGDLSFKDDPARMIRTIDITRQYR